MKKPQANHRGLLLLAAPQLAGQPPVGPALCSEGRCLRTKQLTACFFPDSRRVASQPGLSDLRRAKFARRLPAALSELAGPQHGPVRLPLHLAWSGLTTFDLDQPRLWMSCYRVVLAEGQHDDLVRYLDRDLLVGLWPTLRTLVSRDVREVWESAFGELGGSARAAA